MPFNGSGTFTRNYNWVNDKIAGTPITASRMDAEFDNYATGLGQTITKDGQTTLTGNIPFNNYKITGLGNGSARNDSIALGQVQDGSYTYLGTTTGSADAYTVAPAPTITAYATTQRFFAKIHATNTTTTPYLQISAIANPATTAVIKKLSATKTEIALEASDLIANGLYEFQRNSANDAWIVLNPSKPKDLLATSTAQGIAFLPLPVDPITAGNNSATPNTDVDFFAGTMTLNDNSAQVKATAMTKRLQSTGSWSAGNNGNGLLSGARANSSTYHWFALYKASDNSVDYGCILGVAGTTPDPTSVLPSGYSKYEYIFSCLTNSSGNIRTGIYKFDRNGSYNFEFNDYLSSPDINGSTLTTVSRTLYTMGLPLGIEVKGFFEGSITSSAAIESTFVVATSPNQIDKTIGSTGTILVSNGSSNAISGGGQFYCYTNKSSQIGLKGTRARAIYVNVLGWYFNKI